MTRINTFSLEAMQALKKDHDRLAREVSAIKQNLINNTDSGSTVNHKLSWVWIKNTTSLDLDQYDVVDLTGPVFAPNDQEGDIKFKTQKLFKIDTPQNGPAPTEPDGVSTLRKHAVTQRRIPANTYGPAAISGVTHCLVNLNEVWHRRAMVTPGLTISLQSHPSGFAEIIWIWDRESTGLYWAMVDLGPRVEMRLKATTTQCINPGAEGFVQIWDGHTITNQVVLAHLDWMHCDQRISSGKQLLIEWNDVDQEWWIPNAECEVCPD